MELGQNVFFIYDNDYDCGLREGTIIAIHQYDTGTKYDIKYYDGCTQTAWGIPAERVSTHTTNLIDILKKVDAEHKKRKQEQHEENLKEIREDVDKLDKDWKKETGKNFTKTQKEFLVNLLDKAFINLDW